MEQNINLLAALNLQVTPVLSSKLIMQIICGWALLLLFISVIYFISNTYKREVLTKLVIVQEKLKLQIENSIGQYYFDSASLTGFYQCLVDLAKFTPKDIWLDGITFSHQDNLIILKGNTTNASNIPIFIQSLNKNNSSFNNYNNSFDALQINKIQNSDDLSFVVSTVATAEEKPSTRK